MSPHPDTLQSSLYNIGFLQSTVVHTTIDTVVILLPLRQREERSLKDKLWARANLQKTLTEN